MGVFRVVLDMHVDPVDTSTFAAAWTESATVFQHVDGLLAQTLAADQDRPERFTITSDWLDEGHFRDFETSRYQDRATAPLRRLRRSSTMRTQHLVSLITKG
jgi:heme-degrading monooxygenase HmoA